MTDDEWLENFYATLEKELPTFKRPKDYKERFKRVKNHIHKPVKIQKEGRTKGRNHD